MKISSSFLLAIAVGLGGLHYADEFSERTERNETQREVILSVASVNTEAENKEDTKSEFRSWSRSINTPTKLSSIFPESTKFNVDFIYHTSYLDTFIS